MAQLRNKISRMANFLSGNISKNPYEIAAFISISIFFLVFSYYIDAKITGDGFDYFAALIALAENQSTIITQDIIDRISEHMGYNFGEMALLVESHGLYYPIHFPAYAAINIPAYITLDLFNLSTLKSFQITNTIIISCTAYYILNSKISKKSRWFILAGLLLSTGFYYFQWAGPEIFTAAAITIASVAFLDRRYYFSILFAAIGSLQNPSIILSIPFIAAAQLIEFKSTRNLKPFCIKTISVAFRSAAVSMIALIPYAYSILKFNAFSPIAKKGYLQYSLISTDRLISFIFDINQGLVVGLPMLLYAVTIIFLVRIIQAFKNKKVTLYREDTLIIIFFFIILPTLAQKNWHAGAAVFMRYASWAAMPLLAWTAFNLAQAGRTIFATGAVPALVIQIFVFSYIGGISQNKDIATFKPWTVPLWKKFPHFYNPIPEIFHELVHKKEIRYVSPTTLFVSDSGTWGTEFILRILTKNKDFDSVQNEICKPNSNFQPIDNRPDSVPKIRPAAEYNAYYVSGRFVCSPVTLSPNHKLHYSINNHKGFEGWGPAEPAYRWSVQKDPSISFNIKETGIFSNVIQMHIGTLGEQRVMIALNESQIYSDLLSGDDIKLDISFDKTLLKDGSNTLSFQLPDARQPGNGDPRKLALAFKSLQISGESKYTLKPRGTIYFNVADFFNSSWSGAESIFRWSEGKQASIDFHIENKASFKGIFRLHIGTLGEQRIIMALNGSKIYSNLLSGDDIKLDILFDKALLKDGGNTLSFQLPDARQPGNGDPRILALAFKSLQIK